MSLVSIVFVSVVSSLAMLAIAAVCAMGAMRSSTPAARHRVWLVALVTTLFVPAVSALSLSIELAQSSSAASGPRQFLREVVLVTAPPSLIEVAAPFFVALWCVGVIVLLVRLRAAHRAAHRLLLASAAGEATPLWQHALRDTADRLGVRAETIKLLVSEHIASPMTIGLLRSCIVVPKHLGDDGEHMQAILLHELAHVRRRDNLAQLVCEVAVAISWWNPLAWLAAARVRRERELACDDLVLAAGMRASTYADALFAVARVVTERSGRSPAQALCMVRRPVTSERVARVLDADVVRRSAQRRGTAFGHAVSISASLAIVGALAWGSVALASRAGVSLRATSSGMNGSARIDGLEGIDGSGVLAISSDIDLVAVTAALNRSVPALKECYARRLAERPGLGGEIVMHWNITSSGGVDEQCITSDSVRDDHVKECVNDAIKASHFPPAYGSPVTLSLPFVFQSDEGC